MKNKKYKDYKVLDATPMFNSMLITADLYEGKVVRDGKILDLKGNLKEIQKIVKLGTSCHPSLKEGMYIIFNPTRYENRQFSEKGVKEHVETYGVVSTYKFNMQEIDGKKYIKCYDQDVDCIVEVEEIEKELPKGKLVEMPTKKLSL